MTSSAAASASSNAQTADGLSDAQFHLLSSEVLARVEATLDRWLQDDVIDIDSQRTGGMLELDFPDRSRIVINTQPPLHELWLASRSAGYHFRCKQGLWVDTRDGQEFFGVLSREASTQAGRTLSFSA